jgi:hypothetical protein
MSKVLVIAYSYTGTSRQLSRVMCAQQNWPLGEVTDAIARSGAWGTWRCLLDSWLRRRPPIHYTGPDPRRFDAVVLVAPIWAYRLAGPMRSFVAMRHDDLPPFAVVSVLGSRGAANAVAEIARLSGRTPLLSAAFVTREVEDGSCAARLRAFGQAVAAAAMDREPVRPAVWSPKAA